MEAGQVILGGSGVGGGGGTTCVGEPGLAHAPTVTAHPTTAARSKTELGAVGSTLEWLLQLASATASSITRVPAGLNRDMTDFSKFTLE